MKAYITLIAMLLTISGMQAQLTGEWTVYSTQGGSTTSGTLSFSYTMGQPIVGTTTSGSLAFLEGFQVPETGTVGIEDELGVTVNLSVYPNPTVDQLSVELEGNLTETIHLQLFDATGRAIPGWSMEVREAGVVSRSVASLASGTYFLRLRKADGQPFKAIPIIKL